MAPGARSGDTARQAGRHYTAARLPSFLTPIWPSSEPSTKGNYTTGPDCSCRYCFMAELFQPAPSPAFALTGAPRSTCNRCRKGTLREINRLPSTNQSYRLSGLSGCPTLDEAASLLPCRREGSLTPSRIPAPRNTYQTCCTMVYNRKAEVPRVVPSSTPGEATETTGRGIRWKRFEKFLLLTQGGEKGCRVYPTQVVKPCNQLHIKLTSKTASLMYYVLSFKKDKNSSEVFRALLF